MIILAGLLIAVFGIVLNGWVLSVLWGWFFIPLGFMKIGIAHAIGLACIVSFLINKVGLKKEDISLLNAVVQIISVSLASLLIGYIAHLFI